MKPLVDKPACAAKRLRDIALASGCLDNIAVLVVTLCISTPLPGSDKLGMAAGSYQQTNELSGFRRSGRMLSKSKFEGIQEM